MKLTCVFASLGLWATCAQAIPTLTVVPQTQTVNVGASVNIDIEISGLMGPLALGTFDIALASDPSLLRFATATFGNQLDVLGLGSLQSVTPLSGSVGLFELSLDSLSDLASLQADSFRLATLTFTTLASSAGTPFSLFINALGDADGAAIDAGIVNNSQLVINSVITPVPEPSSFALIGLGFVGLMVFRRIKRWVPDR